MWSKLPSLAICLKNMHEDDCVFSEISALHRTLFCSWMICTNVTSKFEYNFIIRGQFHRAAKQRIFQMFNFFLCIYKSNMAPNKQLTTIDLRGSGRRKQNHPLYTGSKPNNC